MSRKVYRNKSTGNLKFHLRVEHSVGIEDFARVIAEEIAARRRKEEAGESMGYDRERDRLNIDNREAVLDALKDDLYQRGQQYWYSIEEGQLPQGLEGEDLLEEGRRRARDLFPELA
jgi:hypothetical protein